MYDFLAGNTKHAQIDIVLAKHAACIVLLY